jgi:hypothetical protein
MKPDVKGTKVVQKSTISKRDRERDEVQAKGRPKRKGKVMDGTGTRSSKSNKAK